MNEHLHYYGQNLEDKKIAELLGPGYETRSGFYIDIGALGPEEHSVTKHFYDLGWSGINIEPQPAYYHQLCRARPRDRNLQIAISDTGGGVEHAFHVQAVAGLSTFHPKWAAQWENQFGGHSVIQTQTYTLAEVCETHVPHFEIDDSERAKPDDIDFLKIDVEGWEPQVIRGADWERFRPRILCVEATEPGTLDKGTWHEFEDMLIAADYEFVEMEVVNRFYRDKRKRS